MISVGLGQESLRPTLIMDLSLCLAAIALVLGPKLVLNPSAGWWGKLAVLASAALGALCSVLYRPYLRRYPTVQVSCVAMLASVLALALFALAEDWPQRIHWLSGSAWVIVGFIGLSSALGYGLWLFALKHMPATRVTMFLSLSPLTAALLGRFVLGEDAGPGMPWAIALTALGLWLAGRPGRAPPG